MKKQVKLDANGHRPFGIRDSIAYAAGDLGCNMSFALKSTMSIFWTQFMGMDLWYALLLIIVQVWDAVNDPLIGPLSMLIEENIKETSSLHIFGPDLLALLSVGLVVSFLSPTHQHWQKL